MANESRADAVWQGSLTEGSGTVRTASGAGGEMPVSWAKRVDRAGGGTSPEELIAAAHAACFSMALSHQLNGKGHPPRRLETSARVVFDKVEQGFGITTVHLAVNGDVPGLDEAAFREAADAAKEGCPVSRALQGNVEIKLEASLRSGG